MIAQSHSQPHSQRCFREPIGAIFAAADRLKSAVEAHLRGDRDECATLLWAANDPEVREWVSPFLGPWRHNPYISVQIVSGAPPILPKADRCPLRMPPVEDRQELLRRYGHQCAFCGIPLVRVEVRKALHAAYPEAAVWGRTNNDCHAALLCMWLQYDHILPHSRGGGNDLDNLVLTCAACNYGRMSFTLEEVGLADPRGRSRLESEWCGLEGFLRKPRPSEQ